MTGEQVPEVPRRRLKPVWIVVGLALLLLLAGVSIVAFQGYRQRQLVQLVEQRGGHVLWLPHAVAGLPAPVPFWQSPKEIRLTELDAAGFRQFSRAVRRVWGAGDSLTSLRLKTCTFTAADFATLPALPRVFHLEILESRVGATTLNQLDRFPDLWELDLACSSIDDEALAELPVLPKLASLSLMQTQVLGPGLARLTRLPSLKVLVLIDTGVTSAGIAALAGCSRLEQLYLDNTAIDDEAVEYLLQLPALRELSASNTQLTEQGLGRLVEKFPDLEVWDD